MSTKFAQYSYEPLQKHYVRVLELFSVDETASALNIPIDQTSPLYGQLTHSRVGRGPGYDALSYVCGDPTIIDRILLHNVDGRINELGIAGNLTRALKGLRTHNRSRLLWVDAICINQSDLTERSVEVQHMHRIYADATCVHAWIDVDISSMDEAVRRLPNLSPSHVTRPQQADTSSSPLVPFDLDDKSDVYSIGDQAETWRSLVPLCAHPYWTRVWIQQEIYYATKLVLHCGSTTISGEDLGEFLRQIDEKLDLTRDEGSFIVERRWASFLTATEVMGANEPIFYSRRSQNSGRSYRPPKPRKDLYGTLMFVKDFLRASDPKDYIYGILSLVQGFVQGELDIQVNYELSVAQVYTDAAVSLLNCNHTLCFLPEAGFSSRQQQLNLPSWVPDWSNAAPHYGLRHREPLQFTVVPARDRPTDTLHSVSPCRLILTVTGVHIGTIIHLYKDVVVKLEPETEVTIMAAMFQQLKEVARQASEVQEAAGFDGKVEEQLEYGAKLDLQRLAILKAITAFECISVIKYSIANLYEVMDQMLAVIEVFLEGDSTCEPMPTSKDAVEVNGWSDDSTKGRCRARLNLPPLSKRSKHATLDTISNWLATDPSYQQFFLDRVRMVNIGRQLCISRQGLIGLVPGSAALNDEFWFLPGCDVPMLLCPHEGQYLVIGEAHLNDHSFLQTGATIDYAYARARTKFEKSRFRQISLI